jgi:AraC-like DNA-binding protein
MLINPVFLDREGRRKELSNTEYIIHNNSFTDFRGLKDKDPIILDAGATVFICMGGEGKIIVDMHTIHIQRGSFLLLLPYSVVQMLEVSEDIEITLVAAGLGFLEKLAIQQPVENYVSHIREEPCLLLNEQQLKDVINIYGFVEKQYAEVSGSLALEIRSILMTFIALKIVSLYALNQSVEKRKLPRHEQIFRNFTISLAKNFKEYRTVEFYAEEACLTPKHFSMVIKQRSGKLPTEWIAERAIVLIKFLLHNSVMSIQEISNELNFSNQSFFTRYFKKHTGMTPKDFRNQ